MLWASASFNAAAAQTHSIKWPLVIPPLPRIPLNEQVIRIPMTYGEANLTLEATLYLPDGPGPFPLVMLSHGTPRQVRDRRERVRFEAQSWKFITWGFAVVVPMRRGYGGSGGSYAEDEGWCETARYYEAGLASAHDLEATLRFIQPHPAINSRAVILAGHSAGGFASLALASWGPPGLRGVINFGGGRGSRADKLCSPPELIDAFGRFGRTVRVPTLWIYAENDTFFPPPLVRQLLKAFQAGGGPAQLVMLPPFHQEGHFVFSDVRGLSVWEPAVKQFLQRLGVSQPSR
jgi:dienelactone hydrolase